MSWKDLLGHRLLFVTGKGGTGKTSLAAAIGLRCAAEGRRTVVVEIENHAPTLPSVLGVRSSYQPQFAAPITGDLRTLSATDGKLLVTRAGFVLWSGQGYRSQFWLNMQNAVDLHIASAAMEARAG